MEPLKIWGPVLDITLHSLIVLLIRPRALNTRSPVREILQLELCRLRLLGVQFSDRYLFANFARDLDGLRQSLGERHGSIPFDPVSSCRHTPFDSASSDCRIFFSFDYISPAAGVSHYQRGEEQREKQYNLITVILIN